MNKQNSIGIPLIEMVRSLGYLQPSKLSNWVRDIIKNKENFKRFMVTEEKLGRQDARPEKFLVSSDAETLVDNLCILKQFKGFFPTKSNNPKEYPAYSLLKNSRLNLSPDISAEKIFKRLEDEERINKKAQKSLSRFHHILKNEMPINIEQNSLRRLINKVVVENTSEVVDFSDTFRIAAWNELASLKKAFEEEKESSERYIKIAIAFIEFGNLDEALDSLNSAVVLDKTNPVPYAIKSKIYLDLLIKSMMKERDVNATTGFEGTIEHPISSEEYYINTQIENAWNDKVQLHSEFIKSSFQTFQHWCGKDKNERLNVKDFGYDFDLTLNKIFFDFVMHADSKDFGLSFDDIKNFTTRDFAFRYLDWSFSADKDMKKNAKKIFLQTFEFLRLKMHSDDIFISSAMYDVFKHNRDMEDRFQLNLTTIFSWISQSHLEVALTKMIKNFEFFQNNAAYSIAVLESGKMKKLFWNYLGSDGYNKLHAQCDEYQKRIQDYQRINTMHSLYLDDAKISLEEINHELSLLVRPGVEPDRPRLSKKVLEKKLLQLTPSILETNKGWLNVLNEDVWKNKDNDIRGFGEDLYASLFVFSLLSIINNTEAEVSLQLLLNDLNSDQVLSAIVKKTSIHLLEYLFDLIKTTVLVQKRLDEFEKLFDLMTECHAEYENDSF